MNLHRAADEGLTACLECLAGVGVEAEEAIRRLLSPGEDFLALFAIVQGLNAMYESLGTKPSDSREEFIPYMAYMATIAEAHLKAFTAPN